VTSSTPAGAVLTACAAARPAHKAQPTAIDSFVSLKVVALGCVTALTPCFL
jgi:hypothetical protein